MNHKDAAFVYGVIFRFHFTRKLVFFGLVYYLLKTFGIGISLSYLHFLGFLAFFIAYSSIYFVNDLIDSEYDKKRESTTYPKPLAMNIATPRDYLNLSYLHSIIGLTLCFLFSKQLGILVFLTLLTAHLRHFIKSLLPRTVMLFLLEFLNLETLTAIFGKTLIFNPHLTFTYAIVALFYAFLYFGYRKTKMSEKAISLGFAISSALFLTFSFLYIKNLFRSILLVILMGIYSAVWYISVRYIKKDWVMSLMQFIGALVLLAI